MDAEAFPVPEMAADFTLAISDNKYKTGDASVPGCKNEMFHHRAVRHREHHFGASGGERAHAFSFTCRKHDAFHTYTSSCNV
jgi:hypothetical protein